MPVASSASAVALLVSQARLSLGRRESGQIPIRLLYCILSSRAPNEVGVNINWDAFCKGRSSVSLNSMPNTATARLHSSLSQLINTPRNSWRVRNEIIMGKGEAKFTAIMLRYIILLNIHDGDRL